MIQLPSPLLTDQRGSALAEALVCLPVLAAVLAGVVAFNGMYSAKLEAKARARRLAWLQADSGDCPARSCRTGECGRAEAEIRASGLDAALTVHDSRFSLNSFLGDVGRFLLGKVTLGIGLATAMTSPLVGSGRSEQHGVTPLLCNTTRRPTDTNESVLENACRTELRNTEYANAVCP